MSYTKHNWVNGETITDTLLNHLEDGVANASSGGVLIATYTITGVVDDNPQFACDKTFQELCAVLNNGGMVFSSILNEHYFFAGVSEYEKDNAITYSAISVITGENLISEQKLYHAYDTEEGHDIITIHVDNYPND